MAYNSLIRVDKERLVLENGLLFPDETYDSLSQPLTSDRKGKYE